MKNFRVLQMARNSVKCKVILTGKGKDSSEILLKISKDKTLGKYKFKYDGYCGLTTIYKATIPNSKVYYIIHIDRK